MEERRGKTYGGHHEVSVVAAVILMFVYTKLPKSQNVPSKFSSSQIYISATYQHTGNNKTKLQEKTKEDHYLRS
jgi:hypothetical protein